MSENNWFSPGQDDQSARTSATMRELIIEASAANFARESEKASEANYATLMEAWQEATKRYLRLVGALTP